MTVPQPYHRAADFDGLLREHPIGPEFDAFARTISRDELFARQDRLFRRCVARAWETGFYRRLWGAAGSSAATSRASPTWASCRSSTSPT